MKITHRGFTLIELMVTLAVVAIVTTLALPSFRITIMNNRLTTQANEFITDVNIARSEAVKQGNTITITSNNGNNWANGWTITDSGGNTLRVHGALDGTSTLTGGVGSIQYLRTGFISGGATLTFDVCDDRSGETGRRITILSTGRPSIADLICT
jgi:type IV fimbrial biogenesis protein FimT